MPELLRFALPVMQNGNHHLQSVSASSMGDWRRIPTDLPNRSEADEHMSDSLEASAAPVSTENVCPNGDHAAPTSQSSFPSAGMLVLHAISSTSCSEHLQCAPATADKIWRNERSSCAKSSAIKSCKYEQVETPAKHLPKLYCLHSLSSCYCRQCIPARQRGTGACHPGWRRDACVAIKQSQTACLRRSRRPSPA